MKNAALALLFLCGLILLCACGGSVQFTELHQRNVITCQKGMKAVAQGAKGWCEEE